PASHRDHHPSPPRRSSDLLNASGKKGYFLMIEAGRIDHAHHAGNASRALTDTLAMSEAVRVAMQKSSEKDTLIVVTADHSHTMRSEEHTSELQSRENLVCR